MKGHVAANLHVGNTRTTLIAVLTGLLPFIGYPRTLNALAAIDAVTPAGGAPPRGKTHDHPYLAHHGVSSGFGHALTTQLLERADRVIGTVRNLDKVADLREKYPDTFDAQILDVTVTAAVRTTVDVAFAAGRVDVIVSNAGYGLFGAAEEITDAQVDHIIATNLTGSITLIRAALPHLRAQETGLNIAHGARTPDGRSWLEKRACTVSTCCGPRIGSTFPRRRVRPR
ncbi:SDR family NAD(P)-dependent oxidoreductase [Frankia nepalensis]|uniref:SDR family NAD(P)-dependent oxidoreductase n=1 Tax=Frankia nepalensis TaxID=1836974 RepID=A0A937UVE7_9ACTN|nr:SDR family NAD(P)-dependent oxidoreductase [Frankia nepalensis]MBL7632176.1 SDR family NAD(P)-dependent oxidoreductase [Frankia nepalensis]